MKNLLLLSNLVSNPENLIKAAEQANEWRPAATYDSGASKKFRDNDIWDIPGTVFPDLEMGIYAGLELYKHYMGLSARKGTLVAEGLQLNRYYPGGFYGSHVDGYLGAPARQVSMVLYLNEPPPDVAASATGPGGETLFNRQNFTVKPKAGAAVFFPSNFCYPHEARPPVGWTKYCIVTWFNVR